MENINLPLEQKINLAKGSLVGGFWKNKAGPVKVSAFRVENQEKKIVVTLLDGTGKKKEVKIDCGKINDWAPRTIVNVVETRMRNTHNYEKTTEEEAKKEVADAKRDREIEDKNLSLRKKLNYLNEMYMGSCWKNDKNEEFEVGKIEVNDEGVVRVFFVDNKDGFGVLGLNLEEVSLADMSKEIEELFKKKKLVKMAPEKERSSKEKTQSPESVDLEEEIEKEKEVPETDFESQEIPEEKNELLKKYGGEYLYINKDGSDGVLEIDGVEPDGLHRKVNGEDSDYPLKVETLEELIKDGVCEKVPENESQAELLAELDRLNNGREAIIKNVCEACLKNVEKYINAGSLREELEGIDELAEEEGYSRKYVAKYKRFIYNRYFLG